MKILLIEIFILIFLLSLDSTAQNSNNKSGKSFDLSGPYLGQKPPGMIPEIFAPGIISTNLHDDFYPAFSPDMNEVYFRAIGNGKMVILVMKEVNSTWTKPQIAPFSGIYNDFGAFFSRDGKTLFFSSSRPSDISNSAGDLNIWFVKRIGKEWGQPQILDNTINTTQDELATSIGPNGILYFFANYAGDNNGWEIYRSDFVNNKYTKPEKLGPQINTRSDEMGPCIAHDGSFLIYSRSERDGSSLKICFLKNDDTWSNPQDLNRILNLDIMCKFPGLSPDGKFLFLVKPESLQRNESMGRKWEISLFENAKSRYGGGNIYWVDTAFIQKVKDEIKRN